MFIFCYHIYRYGEGGTHSTKAHCSGEQITRGNTKCYDSAILFQRLHGIVGALKHRMLLAVYVNFAPDDEDSARRSIENLKP